MNPQSGKGSIQVIHKRRNTNWQQTLENNLAKNQVNPYLNKLENTTF